MSANFDPKPVRLSKKTPQPQPVPEEEPKRAVGGPAGRRIVQARTTLQLKQRDLAMRANLPVHVVSAWESGEAVFDPKVAKKIAAALKIDPAEL